MRILVIKLVRLGDVLQTLPFLTALRETIDYARIDFVTSASYASVFDGNINVDRLLLLKNNTKQKVLEITNTYLEFDNIENLQEFLSNYKYDLVVNLSSEDSMMMLASSVKSKMKSGAFHGIDNERKQYGDLSIYNATCILIRQFARLNLVDSFILNAGCHIPKGFIEHYRLEDYTEITKSILEKFNLNTQKPIICFQPGTADYFRRWPPEYFAELAILILEHDIQIAILGSLSESPLCDAIIEQIPKHYNVVSTAGLDLKELRVLLSCSSLLITNDTGPMHLAAALSVPTISLNLGYSSPFETGAYSPGSLSIMSTMQCAPCDAPSMCPYNFACREQLSPKAVFYALVSYFSSASSDIYNKRHMTEVLRGCLKNIIMPSDLISMKNNASLQVFSAIQESGSNILWQEYQNIFPISIYEIQRELIAEVWLKQWSRDIVGYINPSNKIAMVCHNAHSLHNSKDELLDSIKYLINNLEENFPFIIMGIGNGLSEIPKLLLPVYKLSSILPSMMKISDYEARSCTDILSDFIKDLILELKHFALLLK